MSFETSKSAGLSPAKQALLARWLKGEDTPVKASMPKRPEDAAVPMTYSQEGVWLNEQLTPGTSVYNQMLGLWLRFRVDENLLRRAVNAVIARHRALRTRVPVVDGKPVVVIEDTVVLPIPEIDLRHLAEPDLGPRLKLLMQEKVGLIYDLENGPLVNAWMIRVADDAVLVLLANHHLVGDGWSSGVISRDLIGFYSAFARGQTKADLPELEAAYDDYAWWQRESLPADHFQKNLDYWKEHLGAEQPAMALPLDRPRPANPTRVGDERRFFLPVELCDGIRALSKREKVSVFMILTAAFQTLLHRISGAREVVVGTAVANRRQEVNHLVGFFVNMIPLKTYFPGKLSFRNLLARVKETVLSGFANQQLPIGNLIDELRRDSVLTPDTPLFQTSLVLQNTPLPDLRRYGYHLRALKYESMVAQFEVTPADSQPRNPTVPVDYTTQTSEFDLSLTVVDPGDRMEVVAEFGTEVLKPDTVEQLCGAFQHLLTSLVDEPDMDLHRHPLIDEAERQRLMVDWNRNPHPVPIQNCFQELFEETVRRYPEQPAVGDDRRTLSYAELNARANALARELINHGAGAETVVALIADRSIGFLTGMQAVFKAGAVYMPVAPSMPAGRAAGILNRAGCTLILADDAGKAMARETADLCTDRPEILSLSAPRAAEPENLPRRRNSPQNLAYVIFTSGSTGLPKGAMLTHAGMINHIFSKIVDLDLTADDIIAQTAPQSFDISVWQFLALLVKGGRVTVADNDTIRQPRAMFDFLIRHKVTIYETVPSFLHVCLDELEAIAPERRPRFFMRKLMVTGEALPPELCRRWLTLYPLIPLINAYGPTECSDDVTHHVIAEPPPEDMINMPIGRSIINTQNYVLDPNLHPMPQGIPGEQWVGGIGVGRGYLNDPSRTARVFMPNPFSKEPGARLYRTGDLVRLLPTETIEFLGRIDFQVKIRGFRIELGEIEAVLAGHPRINNAVVMARESVSGEKWLAAYIVPANGQAPDARSWLKDKLPDYMVPAALVTMDAIPLTSNGKVDRKALPEPSRVEKAAKEYAAPRNDRERLLIDLLGELLGRQSVGIDDNFFEIGGDSIKGIQLTHRLRALGYVMSPLQIFQCRTVAELAEALDGAGPETTETNTPEPFALSGLDAGASAEVKARFQVPVLDAYPLTPTQQGMLFHTLFTPDSDLYYQQFVLELQGELDADLFEKAWEYTIAAHPALRTAFIWEGLSEPLQVVVDHNHLAVDRRNWIGDAGAEKRLNAYLSEDQARHVDPRRPLLMRPALITTAENRFTLVWSFHHLLMDGWSMPLVLRDTLDSYRALKQGAVPKLSSPRPFVDYVAHLRNLDTADAEIFWTRELSGFDEPAPLQIDRGESAGVTTYESRTVYLERSATDALNRMSRAGRLTLNTVMQAVWALLIARYSGRNDVVFGTATAGRDTALTGVEDMVGVFINTLPVRARIDAEEKPHLWLHRFHRRFQELTARGQAPLSKIQEWCGRPRNGSESRLFDTLVVFHNYPLEAVAENMHGFQLLGVRAIERTGYPITLTIQPGEEIRLGLVYDRTRFSDENIEGLLKHYRQLLAGVTADKDAVGRLPMLSHQERTQLLTGINDTSTPLPPEHGVHRFFEKHAVLAPREPAVCYCGEWLTYGELNARANRLARRLRHAGIGMERGVAVVMPRGFEMIIGMLAAAKAGGFYVPVDPAFPAERIAYILQDAHVAAVLASEGVAANLPLNDIPVIEPDRQEPVSDLEGADLNLAISPSQLVYSIYTSGSTGKPKGVMISHRGVVNFLLSMRKRPGLTRNDRLLAVTTLSFDISVLELFLPLVTGARLVIVESEATADGLRLRQLMRDYLITVMQATPATWRLLLASGWKGDRSLKVLCGGEAMPPELLRDLSGRTAGFWNMFGPTETTIWSTIAEMTPGEERVHIGSPIDNTAAYILDNVLEPQPVGLTGHLFIGGVGLARGYHGRPGLTAEKFIPDPFARNPGERLYRTGDLARYREDYNIDFQGRADFQVKLRGYRIELGEIEAVLAQHPEIRQAVVTAREDVPGRKQLAAYVVPEHTVPDDDELRRWTAATLPTYMVPGVFVSLEAMPLTPNRKVDRKRLPAPVIDAQTPRDTGTPRNEAERILTRVFAEVMNLPDLGIHDNFFRRGGDSIVSIQAQARAIEAGYLFTPRQLFENPTIAQLAELACPIDATDRTVPQSANREDLDRMQALYPDMSLQDAYPLSPLQQSMLAVHLTNPGGAAFIQQLLVTLNGPLDRDAFTEAWHLTTQQHPVFRTFFHWDEERPLQVVQADAVMLSQELDWRTMSPSEAEEALESFLEVDRGTGFDLAKAPLSRLTLIYLADNRTHLIWTHHHLIMDGWSLPIVLEDWLTAYAAAASGRKNAPAPREAFASYIRRLEGRDTTSLQSFWHERLADIGAATPPAMGLEAPAGEPVHNSHHWSLDEEATGALEALSKREEVTLNTMIQGVWALLLSRYSGEEDVLFGIVISGRDARVPGIQTMAGCFINAVPLRLEVDEDAPLADWLRHIQRLSREVEEHGLLPPAEIAAQSGVPKGQPLYESVVIFENYPMDTAAMTAKTAGLGLTVEATRYLETNDQPLSLEITPGPCLDFRLSYRADRFSAEAMEQLAGQVNTLLREMAGKPGAVLGELEDTASDGTLITAFNANLD